MFDEERAKLIINACQVLLEHFDSVAIFVTWRENKTSFSDYHSVGNQYAILGQLNEYIDTQRGYAMEKGRRAHPGDEP